MDIYFEFNANWLEIQFFKLWLRATSREIALLCRFKKVLFKGAIFDCKKKKKPYLHSPPPYHK